MMKKKQIMLCVMIILIMSIALLPQESQTNTAVLHQHKNYLSEDEKVVGLDDTNILTSHLPLVILKTNGSTIPGGDAKTDQELYCGFTIIDNDNHLNRSTDTPTQTGNMAINVRGNSSRHFPKKQYAIRTVNTSGLPLKTSFLGMPPETTWVLNGSYIDHSLIRNYMMYNISNEIMGYAPNCRLCEVFLTDEKGNTDYQGVYTLSEKPKVSNVRLDLEPYNPKYSETSFLLQMNRQIDDAKIAHLKPDNLEAYSFNVEYPDVSDLTENSMQYIKKEVLQFEKVLYDAEHNNKWDKLEDYADLDSFIDYYIINEFFQNYDAGIRSTYLYKNVGEKFHIGPVWDFDGAFNNFFGIEFSPDILNMHSTFYYYYLCQNPAFVEKCVERYTELRETVLSEKYLLQYIDDSVQYLGSAALRNYDKWYNGEYSVYYDDIEKMKNFVIERGKWMDKYFK